MSRNAEEIITDITPPDNLRKGSMRYPYVNDSAESVVIVESVGKNPYAGNSWQVAYRKLGGRCSTIVPLGNFLQDFSETEE